MQTKAFRPKPHVSGPVKTIIFDLGNVIVDINLNRVLARLMDFGLDKIKPSDIYPTNTGVFTQLEMGLVSEAEFVKAIQDAVAEGSPIPTHEEVIEAWNRVFEPYDWKRFEMLDGLRAAGYRLLVLSNTNEPHHIFFEAEFNSKNPFGRTFDSYFDAIYYSDQMKKRKPNADIYEEVLQRENILASETLFIDDAKVNVDGAALVGLQVYHLADMAPVVDLFEPLG